jgi:peptidoglycan-N-acetylglucosamine deacetylase
MPRGDAKKTPGQLLRAAIQRGRLLARQRRGQAILLLAASLIVTLGWIWFSPPRWLIASAAGLWPEVLFHVQTDQPLLALTIDDAPHPTVTPHILAALQRHGVRATFFILGEHAEAAPELVQSIRDHGHELGNHLWQDQPSIRLGQEQFTRELLAVDRIIAPQERRWFRPGSGWFDRRMLRTLQEHGYRCVLGSVYPHDTRLRSPRIVARYVLSRAYPGSIIILHDGGPSRAHTPAVIDWIVPVLVERGFRFVTLSELVAAEVEHDCGGQRPR